MKSFAPRDFCLEEYVAWLLDTTSKAEKEVIINDFRIIAKSSLSQCNLLVVVASIRASFAFFLIGGLVTKA